MRGRPEVTTLLATVVGVEAEHRRALLDEGGALDYDGSTRAISAARLIT
jgi:NADH dehydrogenase